MNVVTQIVITFISSGIGAGLVTFALNFMKAERDFLRSKLETLYLAVHKYTGLNTTISALVMANHIKLLKEEMANEDSEHVNQLVVIIDLYFPQLRPQYDEFRKLISETLVVRGELNVDDPDYKTKYLKICQEARKFEKAIVEVSRSHTLLSWGY
jgi:hypothetical protein